VKTIKLTFAPFVNNRSSLKDIYSDMIIAFALPVMILLLTGKIAGNLLLGAIAGFVMSGVIFRTIRKSGNGFKTDMLQYFYFALAGSAAVGRMDSFVAVVISAFAAHFIFEYNFDITGPLLPPFIIFWLFTRVFAGTYMGGFQPQTVWIFAAGCAYLIVRRRLDYYTVLGYMSALTLLFALADGRALDFFRPEALFALMLCACPGLVPYRRISRLLFGILCAIAVMNYGLFGFAAIAVLASLERRL
jgi:hypothetical protein